VIDRAGEIAYQHGVSTARVALAWLLSKPGVTAPIVGATKLEHLEDALAAVDLSLGVDDVAALEEPYVPHPVSGIAL
jgi:aryl-alcohol dehydrogenase-like predicted oxidoreductase